MKTTADTHDLRTLKRAALRNLLVPPAFVPLCMGLCPALRFRKSVVAGVYAPGIDTLAVWLAARGLEQAEVVFDKTAGHVDLHRRTSLRETHEPWFELDEIGRVEVEEIRARGRDASRNPLYKLILMIPKGAKAGRHPLTIAGVRDRHLPRLAENVTHWLERTR